MNAGDGCGDFVMPSFFRMGHPREHGAVVLRAPDKAAMIRPYLGKPLNVLIAARELAAHAAGEKELEPHEVEELQAIVRTCGMEWSAEGPNA